jgi:hypothetical protein
MDWEVRVGTIGGDVGDLDVADESAVDADLDMQTHSPPPP